MKVLYKLCIVISLVITSCVFNSVHAYDYKRQIDEELKLAIISGDGSADNPYIVDYEKAPYFREYLDNINNQVMASLQGKTNISLFGLYDKILVGEDITSQKYGGEWLFNGEVPNVDYNGNIWMRKVIYINPSDTKLNRDSIKNEIIQDVLLSNLYDIASMPYKEAVKVLMSEGMGELASKALLKSVGRVFGIYNTADVLNTINNCFKLANYTKAVDKGYGMINALYCTAYQSSWYAQYGEDSWTTPYTVYLPNEHYGKGKYTSYSF